MEVQSISHLLEFESIKKGESAYPREIESGG
jgi:hypothetical protein